MAKRKSTSKKAFTKKVLVTLAGAAVGVVANRALNDALTAGGYNPSVLAPLVVSDVAVLAAEIGGAYYYRTKKPKASRFLVSMAAGSVAADIYQVAGTANWWNVLNAPARTQSFAYGQGKYGRATAYPAMNFQRSTYPRR